MRGVCAWRVCVARVCDVCTWHGVRGMAWRGVAWCGAVWRVFVAKAWLRRVYMAFGAESRAHGGTADENEHRSHIADKQLLRPSSYRALIGLTTRAVMGLDCHKD